MTLWLKRSVFGLAVLGLVMLASCQFPERIDGQTDDPDLDFRINVIQLVDQARNQTTNCAGTWMPATTRLAEDTRMNTAAETHSMDMKQRRYVGRQSPSGETISTRLAQQSVYPCTMYDMELGLDNATPRMVVARWLSARDTCMKIMSPEFDHLGFGRADNKFTLYLAQLECNN
jgi:uncharacterized protein YkwD